MFFIRRAHPDDQDTLLKLAKTVYFINLPPDKDLIAERIRRSRASFLAAATGEQPQLEKNVTGVHRESPVFMFCLIDSTTDNALGTSSIIARMGGPGNPNIALELRKREFFSQDLGAGTTHITAKLVLDETGPTEIGGLILGPSFRNHPEKLGKQLSLVRFHYIGLHRDQFADKVIAEMMAPITPDGHNTFWEYFGRRFINLSYSEADKFCAHSREFMISLLPREEIYLSLLPPEARALVGKVGPETVPARKMLESLGFRYTNRVDPFDAGPNLEVVTDELKLVRDTRRLPFGGVCAPSQADGRAFVSLEDEEGDFRCVYTPYLLEDGVVSIPKEYATPLEVEEGQLVGFTPVEPGEKKSKSSSKSSKSSSHSGTNGSTSKGASSRKSKSKQRHSA